ncbi:type I secretion system ATPase [Sphaerotilus natans subsp. natans DSM 6575]|uniref:Cyclolysin secretion/processing ATP-binding protein CyaB n=1 Tax=Sphaerotilus natans subsp. natans DSM 6575 TaxID=1286631 RepID=A0A059KQK8_9BURK|nr:type I secretion system permease/ATPase [Sphaerotilus natans]KDB53635.1 type I secretion system ATPase [Sphaerotilus natans subsp. natans DSM 6575]SIR89189.1 ATP-binding cassette, subfamily C, LapB [Sphaerotilus natans]
MNPNRPGAPGAPAAAAPVPPSVPRDPATERLREDLIHPDPLLDCLLEVCRLHGVASSRAALSAGLPLENGRLTLALAERAAQRAGLSTKLQRLRADRIDTATLPAILILRGSSACVLLGWTEEGDARVLLPETGQGAVVMPRKDLARRHGGVVLFVRPHFRFDERTPEVRRTRSGHWFWSAIASQRGVYRDVLWAALLINLFALAFPIFTMNVYDRVVPNHAVETLWVLALGLLLVLLADLYMRSLRSHFVDEASARIDVQLSSSLMERVLGMRLEHRPQSVGSFAANLRGFETVRDFIASSTVTAMIDLPFALIFLAVMAWISPWMVLPVVAAFVLILVIGFILQHRLHELSESTYQASAQRNATLVEALTGIETIKTQAAEGVIQARWERVNLFLARTNVRMRALSSHASYGTQWLSQIVSLSVILIGVHLISQRELTMGALIACTTLASRALAPAGQIVGLLMQYQGARTALESLDRIMAQPVEREPGAAFLHRREIRGDIELRDVRFAYPGRDDPVLDGISLKIARGERVALIGRVGSGKTTIQKLMLGLYQPTSGAVLLDGIDLRQLDPADVRRNLGYVSQDVTLFYGSLRENITMGLPYADENAVLAAAETACLLDFVNRHPKGFDMPVGERGELLSGGQRQSVGLARAVLHNAPLLLLDEPTSAMDFSTEAQVTKRVTEFAQGRTVVLVTHRTSMLALVDRVVVVDQGRIVADGPRDRILEALQSGRIARAA